MATSRIARGETVDVSDFSRFAKVLRKKAPESATKMRKGLRASGMIVSERTKANASFSSRIPGSVSVRTSGASVSVTAGGTKAPNAAPIENKGKGYVRHPVFGDMSNWTGKNSHGPWFTPAVHDAAPFFRKAMTDVLEDTVQEVINDMRG